MQNQHLTVNEEVPRSQPLGDLFEDRLKDLIEARGYSNVNRVRVNPLTGSLVFSAVDRDGLPVVIKVLNFLISDRFTLNSLEQRYNTEVRLLLEFKSRSENISGDTAFPELIDNFEINDNKIGQAYFIVTRRVPAEPLSELTNLTSADVIKILIGAIKALHQLHQRNFIHGDLRPENILYDRSTGRVWLIDFDLSRSSQVTTLTFASQGLFYPIDASSPKPQPSVDLVALARVVLRTLVGDEYDRYLMTGDASEITKLIEGLPYSLEVKNLMRILSEENPDKRLFTNAQDALTYLENPNKYLAEKQRALATRSLPQKLAFKVTSMRIERELTGLVRLFNRTLLIQNHDPNSQEIRAWLENVGGALYRRYPDEVFRFFYEMCNLRRALNVQMARYSAEELMREGSENQFLQRSWEIASGSFFGLLGIGLTVGATALGFNVDILFMTIFSGLMAVVMGKILGHHLATLQEIREETASIRSYRRERKARLKKVAEELANRHFLN
ncbi:MAG: protein kinase [Deltaproteobacteria bacterium]|nr:protein kinase [Deltaproteobacteria bacterium]